MAAYEFGVLTMFAAPFTIAGFIGFLLWRSTKVRVPRVPDAAAPTADPRSPGETESQSLGRGRDNP